MSLTLKRIKKDLVELTKHPLVGASASPIGDDLTKWHFTLLPPGDLTNSEGKVTLTSTFKGIPFHGLIEFPNDYPSTAPSVYFLHEIPRGSVAGDKTDKGYNLCMNFNSNWDHYHSSWKYEKGSGWAPSSSLATLLLMIQQAFLNLNSENIFRDGYRTSTGEVKKQALTFKCPECGHDGSHVGKYLPEIILHDYMVEELELEKMKLAAEDDSEKEETESEKKEETKSEKKEDTESEKKEEETDSKKKEESELEKKEDKIQLIVETLKRSDQKKETNHGEIKTSHLMCYVSYEVYGDEENEDLILGIGIFQNGTVLRYEKEYLSLEAFQSGVDRSSQKEKFNYWFPIYVDKKHWKRARPKFLEQIQRKHIRFTIDAHKFNLVQDEEKRYLGRFLNDWATDPIHQMYNNSWSSLPNLDDGFLDYYYSILRTVLAFRDEFEDFSQKMLVNFPTNWKNEKPNEDHFLTEYLICLWWKFEMNEDDLRGLIYEIEVQNANDIQKKVSDYKKLNIHSQGRITNFFPAYLSCFQQLTFNYQMMKLIKQIGLERIDEELNGCFPREVKEKFKQTMMEIYQLKSYEEVYRLLDLKYDSKLKGRELKRLVMMNWYKDRWRVEKLNDKFGNDEGLPKKSTIRMKKHRIKRFKKLLKRGSDDGSHKKR